MSACGARRFMCWVEGIDAGKLYKLRGQLNLGSKLQSTLIKRFVTVLPVSDTGTGTGANRLMCWQMKKCRRSCLP